MSAAAILGKVSNALRGVAGFAVGDGTFRVYAMGLLPQLPTYPAMTYQVISATPADSITQLARFSDYRVQVSIFDRDADNVAAVRTLVLAAMEAMPEYITRDTDMQGPYQFEPKVFEWILDFHLRDAES